MSASARAKIAAAQRTRWAKQKGQCQGRSKTRPLGRSKSRPVQYGRRPGIVGEEGVWSGGLRRLQGGAFRPERKTSSSPRRVRRRGSGRGVRRGGGGSGGLKR